MIKSLILAAVLASTAVPAIACSWKEVTPVGAADYGQVRGAPRLDGNQLWRLNPGSHVNFCGLTQVDFRGITWAWVSFKSVQEPWDHDGWMSTRILTDVVVQDTPAPAPVAAPAPQIVVVQVPAATPAPTLDAGQPKDIPTDAFRDIVASCEAQWRDNSDRYLMTSWCEKKEFDAIREMRTSNR